MIRFNKNLVLFLGLFLSGGTILLLVTEKFLPLINHVTYYCQSFINSHMTPIPYFLSVIPVLFLGIIIAFTILKLFILLFKTQLIKRSLKKNIITEYGTSSLIKKLNLEDRTIIVKSNSKFAFCLGYRNPKIYISTGLISKLSLKELAAVLHHEQYHLENRDTLILMVASITQSLFPFFPLVDDLIKKYRIEREVSADKFVVYKMEEKYSLISALKKLLAFPSVENLAFAAIADGDTLEPRIYSLINKPYPQRQFKLKHLLITIFSALVIGFIFISPIYAEEIHSDNQDVVMLCDGGKCTNSCSSTVRFNKTSVINKNSSEINTSRLFTPANK